MKLKDYTELSYQEIAESFHKHFLRPNWLVSESELRFRYEVSYSEIDHWINRQNFGFDNLFGKRDTYVFKSNLKKVLCSMGWVLITEQKKMKYAGFK